MECVCDSHMHPLSDSCWTFTPHGGLVKAKAFGNVLLTFASLVSIIYSISEVFIGGVLPGHQTG